MSRDEDVHWSNIYEEAMSDYRADNAIQLYTFSAQRRIHAT